MGKPERAPIAPEQQSASPGDENTPRSLAERAEAAGIFLTPTQIAQFDRFRQLLMEWNARFNLTAVKEPAAIDERLFANSLALLPFLDRYVETFASGEPLPRLLDIGSGAGIPGLAIKIARPEWQVTSIDGTGKKITFQKEVIAALQLPDTVAIHGRAEELAHDRRLRGHFDLVTARAVAALPVLMELGVPFLRELGRAFFPKGLDLEDELDAGRRAAPLVGGRIEAVHRLEATATTLVETAKIGQTPSVYPRRAGLPAKDPLGSEGRRVR